MSALPADLTVLSAREINALRDQYARPSDVPVALAAEIARRNAAHEATARRMATRENGQNAASWFYSRSFNGRAS